MRNVIIQGDALSVLRTLPDGLVQTVVTSPPYFGLRSYLPNGHEDKPLEIGLEESLEMYIAKLVEVFREVRRVLRKDGTCWVNIGDGFANDTKWGGTTGGKHVQELHGDNVMRHRRYTGLKPKDLMMIPARLAIALQEDGWWLRQDVIWYKPSALCESVEDRPSSTHEHVFLLTKSARYFYDADSIREPLKPKTLTTFGTKHQPQGNDALGLVKSDNWGRTVDERQPRLAADGTIAGANKRNVWTIATQPFSAASLGFTDIDHFATFPEKLAEIPILAGTSPRACEHCGTPWERVTIPTGHVNKREVAHVPGNSFTKTDSTGWAPTKLATANFQPGCKCSNNTGSGKCIVLDPFAGAGTSLLVASQLGRDWLGVELNVDYIRLIEKRIACVQPNLWEVTAS